MDWNYYNWNEGCEGNTGPGGTLLDQGRAKHPRKSSYYVHNIT